MAGSFIPRPLAGVTGVRPDEDQPREGVLLWFASLRLPQLKGRRWWIASVSASCNRFLSVMGRFRSNMPSSVVTKGRLVGLPLPVLTPRLMLRPPSQIDVPDLKRMFRNPQTARAAGAPLHSTVEMKDPSQMVRRTRREFAAGTDLSMSVVLTATGSCIGRVGLRGIDWKWRKVESLAYWLDPRYWNRGLTTEASWFVCKLAFDRLRMRRISSQALDRNPASQAVLRRLGFVEEGRERQSVCAKGRCMDMILFGLLAEELRPLTGSTDELAAVLPR